MRRLQPKRLWSKVSRNMAKEETAVKEYEIAYLAKDDTGADLVRKAIAREGGEIFLENPAERISLAYKINKEAAAYFGYFHFRVSPEALPGLDHELKTNAGVLRFLVITPPFLKDKPRPALRPRSAPLPADSGAAKVPPPPLPLSNEALERKIEEILQE